MFASDETEQSTEAPASQIKPDLRCYAEHNDKIEMVTVGGDGMLVCRVCTVQSNVGKTEETEQGDTIMTDAVPPSSSSSSSNEEHIRQGSEASQDESVVPNESDLADMETEADDMKEKKGAKPVFDSTHNYVIASDDFGTKMYVTTEEALAICTRIQKLRAKGWGMAVPMNLILFDSTVAASVGYLSNAEIQMVAERQEKEGLIAGIRLIPCKNAECKYKKMQISVDPACSEDCCEDNAFEVYKSVYWRDDNTSDKTVSAYSARSPPSALLWCNNPWRVCDNCLDLDEKKGYVDPMRKHVYDTLSINTDEQDADLACDECCESTFDHISAVNRVTWRRAHDFKEFPVLGDGKIMLEKPFKTIEQVTDEEKQAAKEAKAAESTKAVADESGSESDSEMEAEDEYDYKNGDWNNGYVYNVNEAFETGFRIPASEFKRIHKRIVCPVALASDMDGDTYFVLIDQSIDEDKDDPEIDYLTEVEYERVLKYNTPEKQAELAKLAKVIPKQTEEDKQIRFNPRHKFSITLQSQLLRKIVPTIEEARQIYARLHREDDDNFSEADLERLSKSELHNENTVDSNYLTVSEEKMITDRLDKEDKAAFVFDPKTSYMILAGSTDFYKPTPEEAKPIAARLWPSRFDSDKEIRTTSDLQLYNETEETSCGYLTAEESKFVRGRHAFDEAEKNANGAPVFHEEDTYVVCDNSGTELTTLTKEEALDIITRIRKDGGEAWAVYKAHDEDQLKHLDLHPATGRPDRWELQEIVEGIDGNDRFSGYLNLEEQKEINLRMKLDKGKDGYTPLANPRKFARLNGDDDIGERMDTSDEQKPLADKDEEEKNANDIFIYDEDDERIGFEPRHKFTIFVYDKNDKRVRVAKATMDEARRVYKRVRDEAVELESGSMTLYNEDTKHEYAYLSPEETAAVQSRLAFEDKQLADLRKAERAENKTKPKKENKKKQEKQEPMEDVEADDGYKQKWNNMWVVASPKDHSTNYTTLTAFRIPEAAARAIWDRIENGPEPRILLNGISLEDRSQPVRVRLGMLAPYEHAAIKEYNTPEKQAELEKLAPSVVKPEEKKSKKENQKKPKYDAKYEADKSKWFDEQEQLAKDEEKASGDKKRKREPAVAGVKSMDTREGEETESEDEKEKEEVPKPAKKRQRKSASAKSKAKPKAKAKAKSAKKSSREPKAKAVKKPRSKKPVTETVFVETTEWNLDGNSKTSKPRKTRAALNAAGVVGNRLASQARIRVPTRVLATKPTTTTKDEDQDEPMVDVASNKMCVCNEPKCVCVF